MLTLKRVEVNDLPTATVDTRDSPLYLVKAPNLVGGPLLLHACRLYKTGRGLEVLHCWETNHKICKEQIVEIYEVVEGTITPEGRRQLVLFLPE